MSGESVLTDHLIHKAIEAERERIIHRLRTEAHDDDWSVPCIYINRAEDIIRGQA